MHLLPKVSSCYERIIHPSIFSKKVLVKPGPLVSVHMTGMNFTLRKIHPSPKNGKSSSKNLKVRSIEALSIESSESRAFPCDSSGKLPSRAAQSHHTLMVYGRLEVIYSISTRP